MQKFWSLDYSSQVPDYQDFQIIKHWIKGILPYIMKYYTFSCLC